MIDPSSEAFSPHQAGETPSKAKRKPRAQDRNVVEFLKMLPVGEYSVVVEEINLGRPLLRREGSFVIVCGTKMISIVPVDEGRR